MQITNADPPVGDLQLISVSTDIDRRVTKLKLRIQIIRGYRPVRVYINFSCEVHWATTAGMHRLQMRIICGCKFVTSTHLRRQHHTE